MNDPMMFSDEMVACGHLHMVLSIGYVVFPNELTHGLVMFFSVYAYVADALLWVNYSFTSERLKKH